MNRTISRTMILAAMALISLPILSPAAELVRVGSIPAALELVPVDSSPYRAMHLTISGQGRVIQRQFGAGEPLVFDVGDLPDGNYTWEVSLIPQVKLRRGEIGVAPAARTQSGYFTVEGGLRIDASRAEAGGLQGETSSLVGETSADQVILDDLIVDGSACIGIDCANGESFGFDTLRLKENNLRLKFDDTSSSASFPNNDWQLTANESDNGGANKFSIDDVTAGKIPFTIEAGARTNSLYVDDKGRLGIGTSTPVIDGVHIKYGNTPTLRLEQDGSSGFTPQTWDLAGNETNFFIRDATNGSKLPFRIKPGAPDNSIFITASGAVGLGTDSPSGEFHVATTGGDFVIESDGKFSVQSSASPVFAVQREGTARFVLEDVAAGATWQLGNEANGAEFRLTKDGTGATEMTIDSGGNLTVNGTVTPMSSRRAKTGFRAVDPQSILRLATELPIETWSYRADDPSVRHLGPVAEDFHAAFGLGKDDTGISTTDISGVALASIQALNQRIEEKDAQIESLATRVAQLEALIETLVQAQQ